jgi:hypothetical protein
LDETLLEDEHGSKAKLVTTPDHRSAALVDRQVLPGHHAEGQRAQRRETAWREAQEGGCSNNLWTELAAKREKKHPEDALPIYQRQLEPVLDRKNNEAYKEALGFL